MGRTGRLGLIAGLVITVASGAGPARAQLAPFVMGSQLGERFAGVDTQIAFFDGGATDFTAINVDLAVDVPVAQRLTFFGRLPICWYHSDIDPGEDDTGTGLGNLTLGLRSRIVDKRDRQGGRTIVGGTASVSLPTSDDTGDDAVAALAAATANVPHEVGYYIPDATTLRLGGDVVLAQRRLFFQGQIALHMYFFDRNGTIHWNDDQVNLFRVGAAFGVMATRYLAVVAELSLLSGLIEQDDAEELIESIDLGVRWKARGVTLGARLYLPFDDPVTLGLGFHLYAHL